MVLQKLILTELLNILLQVNICTKLIKNYNVNSILFFKTPIGLFIYLLFYLHNYNNSLFFYINNLININSLYLNNFFEHFHSGLFLKKHKNIKKLLIKHKFFKKPTFLRNIKLYFSKKKQNLHTFFFLKTFFLNESYYNQLMLTLPISKLKWLKPQLALKMLYLNLFFQKITYLPIQITSINTEMFISPQLIKQLVILFLQNKIFSKRIPYLIKIAELFYLSFYLKHLNWLTYLIKRQLEQKHFKKHKFLFILYYKILYKIFYLLQPVSNIVGLYCIFSGKLGLGGSVRKRTRKLKLGLTTLSTKSIRVKSSSQYIWTLSGAVGFKMFLFYK